MLYFMYLMYRKRSLLYSGLERHSGCITCFVEYLFVFHAFSVYLVYKSILYE